MLRMTLVPRFPVCNTRLSGFPALAGRHFVQFACPHTEAACMLGSGAPQGAELVHVSRRARAQASRRSTKRRIGLT